MWDHCSSSNLMLHYSKRLNVSASPRFYMFSYINCVGIPFNFLMMNTLLMTLSPHCTTTQSPSFLELSGELANSLTYFFASIIAQGFNLSNSISLDSIIEAYTLLRVIFLVMALYILDRLVPITLSQSQYLSSSSFLMRFSYLAYSQRSLKLRKKSKQYRQSNREGMRQSILLFLQNLEQQPATQPIAIRIASFQICSLSLERTQVFLCYCYCFAFYSELNFLGGFCYSGVFPLVAGGRQLEKEELSFLSILKL